MSVPTTRRRLHSVAHTTLFNQLRLLRSVDHMTSERRARSHGANHTASVTEYLSHHEQAGYTPSKTRRRRLQGLGHTASAESCQSQVVGYVVPVPRRRIHDADDPMSKLRRRFHSIDYLCVGCTMSVTCSRPKGVEFQVPPAPARPRRLPGGGYMILWYEYVARCWLHDVS